MRVLIAIFSALFLGGCLGLQKHVPLQIVAPPSASETGAISTTTRNIDRQLTVARPTASAMLDGQRIIARHGDNVLAYLADVTLPDNAPRLVQDRLIEMLQGAGFRAVERQGSGLRGDLWINLQLHRFEVDYSEPEQPRTKVAIQLLLIDGATGRALESRRFEAFRESGKSPAAAARSLLAALDQVLAESAAWLGMFVAALLPQGQEPAPNPDEAASTSSSG